MKRLLKDILALADYFLFRIGVKKEKIKVHSVEETIDELLNNNKSMVRFGDGEITMMRGRSLVLQKSNPQLMDELKRIVGFQHEGLIVTLPDIFNGLDMYCRKSRFFWRDHLFFSRKTYEKYCDVSKTYYNTTISRFYITLCDHERSRQWIEKLKMVWKDKDIVIVEGEKTHNGVGNDLLASAKSIERIICPSSNAYAKLDELYNVCLTYGKDKLFLLSAGAAAKPLAEKLFLAGYRVLDIGNLDMEYEWFLARASEKGPIAKHNVVGVLANREAGYLEYLEQIKYRGEMSK